MKHKGTDRKRSLPSHDFIRELPQENTQPTNHLPSGTAPTPSWPIRSARILLHSQSAIVCNTGPAYGSQVRAMSLCSAALPLRDESTYRGKRE